MAADLELGRHAELIAELQGSGRARAAARAPAGAADPRPLPLRPAGRGAGGLPAGAAGAGRRSSESSPGASCRSCTAPCSARTRSWTIAARRRDPSPSRGAAHSWVVDASRPNWSSALEDALDGRGRLVLVVGEPGIGKSRLADELMAQATRTGTRVLVGPLLGGRRRSRVLAVGAGPARLRAETEPEALRAQLGAGAGDLAQLLPELRDLFPDLPVPPAPGVGGRPVPAVRGGARRSCAALREVGPLVLVLDDLHAADEPSLLLLRFIAREIARAAACSWCARCATSTPRCSEPLTSALAELARESHCSRSGSRA